MHNGQPETYRDLMYGMPAEKANEFLAQLGVEGYAIIKLGVVVPRASTTAEWWSVDKKRWLPASAMLAGARQTNDKGTLWRTIVDPQKAQASRTAEVKKVSEHTRMMRFFFGCDPTPPEKLPPPPKVIPSEPDDY